MRNCSTAVGIRDQVSRQEASSNVRHHASAALSTNLAARDCKHGVRWGIFPQEMAEVGVSETGHTYRKHNGCGLPGYEPNNLRPSTHDSVRLNYRLPQRTINTVPCDSSTLHIVSRVWRCITGANLGLGSCLGRQIWRGGFISCCGKMLKKSYTLNFIIDAKFNI
jgi:hypothetical protein